MKSFITSLFLLSIATLLSAQTLEPVKWTFKSEKVGADEYNLIFTAEMDDSWNVYSQYVEEGGPVPTSINYETEGVVELVGKAEETGHKKEGHDAIFGMNVIKFLSDQPFVITQKVKVLDRSKPLTGYLTFMTCDDERCLPPTDVDFSFDFEKGTGAVKSQSDANSSIAAAGQKKKSVTTESRPVHWQVASVADEGDHYVVQYEAEVHPQWVIYSQTVPELGPLPTTINYETEGVEVIESNESGHKKEGFDKIFEMNVTKYLSDQPFVITQKIKKQDGVSELKGYINYMSCNDSKCIPFDEELSINLSTMRGLIGDEVAAIASAAATRDGNVIDQRREKLLETGESPKASCGGETKTSNSLFWMFIFGFLGGLLALLTPCVFPMIPLTVSFFTKDTRRKGWWNGTIYALSIIVIYVTIGLAVTMIFGEEALNRLSTNWIANTLFFIIFIFFALSFFGYYEITLPSSWSNKSDRMADKGGLIGIFFMAFTLALVSFSCTGPIIGTALVQAASNPLGPFIVMLGFSIALALPFGLFAAFPAWLNSLPRSGGWMTNVKVILGFLELALAFKFLSVADMTNHWGFLRYEVFMVIWVVIAIAMALWAFGIIRFPHDAPVKNRSPRRWAFILGTVGLAAYLMSGFIYKPETNNYNSLPLLSGIAPPSTYNFFLPESKVDADIKAKYPSYGKCANDINCFKDYYEGLAYAKENNKPVLIDHTGHGCVNCRKTEEHIWVNDEVRNMLNDDFVLISLYVDDDKKLDELLISKSRNKKMRNIGNMWADFQIVNFKQNSQPLYVMVNSDEEVLSAPRGYKEGTQDYIDFLKCGLKAGRE